MNAKLIKKYIIAMLMVFSFCCIGIASANCYAKTIVEESRAYIAGETYKIKIPKKDGEILKCKSSNKKVVKVSRKGDSRKVAIKAKKTGTSIIKIKTENKIYKYSIYVAKESTVKKYKGNKIKITLQNVAQKAGNVVIRVKVSNGKKIYLSYLETFDLQKKVNGKWKDIPTNFGAYKTLEGHGWTISEKTSKAFPILLSNNYDNLTMGKYRKVLRINDKNKYVYFELK